MKNLTNLMLSSIIFLSCNRQIMIVERDSISKKSEMTENEIQVFEANKTIDKDHNFSYIYTEKNGYTYNIVEYPTVYLKAVTNKSNYRNEYIYDKQTRLIKSDKSYFLDGMVGVRHKYDSEGKVIESEDSNKGFTFSIQQLIAKMRKEYQINLNIKNDKIEFYKLMRENIPVYCLYFPTNDVFCSKRLFVIDGTNGNTIMQKVGLFEID